TLLADRPLPSVAVTVISYDVSADASPVAGIVNDPARPVSGPTNGWKCVPWCRRTVVLMFASLRSKPAASRANALYVIVSPAWYSWPSVGEATVSSGGSPTWMITGCELTVSPPAVTDRRAV